MKKLLFSFVKICLFFSCSKNNDEVQKPGMLSLSFNQLNDQNSYDLGDISGTKQYYFTLINTGDQPVFDIELSTDNPSFEIFPKKIKYLGSLNNMENIDSNQISIISLGVEHGKKLEGFGYGSSLTKGLNSSVITIKGKSIENGDTVTIKLTPTVLVNAKLMDIRLYYNENEINLNTPTHNYITYFNSAGLTPFYYTNFNNKNIRIENTGNVEIEIQIFGTSNDTITIAPNESTIVSDISPKICSYHNSEGMLSAFQILFKLSGNGVAVDNNKLYLKEDGNAYFVMYRNE
jgi:hypothetical protein